MVGIGSGGANQKVMRARERARRIGETRWRALQRKQNASGSVTIESERREEGGGAASAAAAVLGVGIVSVDSDGVGVVVEPVR